MISTKKVSFAVFAAYLSVLLTMVSSNESSQRVRLKESEPVILTFQYDFESDIDIQIRIGNQRPFYRSQKIDEAGLTKSQIERFEVHVEDHEPHDTIHVRVMISPVSREDEGTIICDMLKNGTILEEHTKKIGVSVDFPPGKAFCRQHDHHIDNSNSLWALMKCSATLGSDLGIIECYQDGERMPPWGRPSQNETTFTQMIWMRKSFSVYCCASLFVNPKGLCQCVDFLWDPVTQSEILVGVLNPCHDSEDVSPSVESHTKLSPNPTIDSHLKTDNGNNLEEKYCSHYDFIPVIFVFVTLIMIIQILTIGALAVLFKTLKNAQVFPKTIQKDKELGIKQSSTKPGNYSDAARKRWRFKHKSSESYPQSK